MRAPASQVWARQSSKDVACSWRTIDRTGGRRVLAADRKGIARNRAGNGIAVDAQPYPEPRRGKHQDCRQRINLGEVARSPLDRIAGLERVSMSICESLMRARKDRNGGCRLGLPHSFDGREFHLLIFGNGVTALVTEHHDTEGSREPNC